MWVGYIITIWLQQSHTETSLYSSKGDLQTDHCLKQIQAVCFNRRHLHTRRKPTGTPSKWRASPISTGRGLSLGGDRWWRAGQSHPVKKNRFSRTTWIRYSDITNNQYLLGHMVTYQIDSYLEKSQSQLPSNTSKTSNWLFWHTLNLLNHLPKKSLGLPAHHQVSGLSHLGRRQTFWQVASPVW